MDVDVFDAVDELRKLYDNNAPLNKFNQLVKSMNNLKVRQQQEASNEEDNCRYRYRAGY